MPTFDNDTRSSKTPRKRSTTTGDAPARKRTTRKKTTETASLEPGANNGAGAGAASTTKTAVTPIVPAASAKTPSVPAVATSGAPRPVPLATGARPDPVIAKVVDADERRRMIAEAAYHKFLERGPGNGTPTQDWYDAEAEIDALLAEQEIPRAQ